MPATWGVVKLGKNGMAIANLEHRKSERYSIADQEKEEWPDGKLRNPSSRRRMSVCVQMVEETRVQRAEMSCPYPPTT